MNINYKKQAKDFLEKYNLSLNVRQAVPQKKPIWSNKGEVHGINYYCTLSNRDGKAYSFDYWGSIHDAMTGKNPTAYDILACLNTQDDGLTFEDFCTSYGYDTDSITAEKTYKAVQYQTAELKKVLTKEAEAELNEIV